MNLNCNMRTHLTSNGNMVQDGVSQKSQCLCPYAFIPGNTLGLSAECLSNLLSFDGSSGILHKHIIYRPYVEVTTLSL